MAETQQDKEFKAFGITGKLRTGVITAFLGLSIGVNIWSIKALVKSADEKVEIQREATKEATQQAIEMLRPDIIEMKQKVNTSSNRIDTAVNAIQEITGGKK